VTHHADSVTHHAIPDAADKASNRRKQVREANVRYESLDELTPDAIESAAQRARKRRTSG
jgi:hypothetical protein